MNDFSQLDALLSRIQTAAQTAIPVAAAVVRANIEKRTAEGKNANNQEFPKWRSYNNKPSKTQPYTYSPGQSKKRALAGKRTDIKNIEFTGATMNSIALRSPSGTASPVNGTQLATSESRMPIMVGQMEHPNWQYHHNVLGVNERDLKDINAAVQLHVKEAIG